MALENSRTEDEITLADFWHIIVKNIWLIFLIIAGFTLIAGILVVNTPTTYLATGSLLPLEAQHSSLDIALGSLPIPGMGGSAGASDKLQTILQSKRMAREVVDKLEIVSLLDKMNKGRVNYLDYFDISRFTKKPEAAAPGKSLIDSNQKKIDEAVIFLQRNVTFVVDKTGMIEIKAEWFTPATSADIVNTYVSSLSTYLNNYSLNINFQVLDPALPPTKKYKPKKMQALVIAGIFSAFISLFIVFIKESFGKKG